MSMSFSSDENTICYDKKEPKPQICENCVYFGNIENSKVKYCILNQNKRIDSTDTCEFFERG